VPLTIRKASLRTRICRRLKTTPYEYQFRGIRFAERHNGRVLNADEPGLGKTIQAIGWSVIHPEVKPIIIVCPASVKYQWQNEWRIHAGLKSHILDGTIINEETARDRLRKTIKSIKSKKRRKGPWVVRRAILTAKKRFRDTQSKQRQKELEIFSQRIIILNYDILNGWLSTLLKLEGIQNGLLVIDESHYCKHRGSLRTKATRLLASKVKHVIALSGTPIDGKPAEFFPVLQMLRPQEFPSFWKFGFLYCSPKRNRWSGGWDFTGSSNLEALHKRLKPIMIRREKRKVLKDLPPKTRTVLPVDIDNRPEYNEAEADFLEWLRKKKGTDAWDRATRAEAIVRLNGLKHLCAEGKINTAVQWIRDWLDGTSEKLLLFTIHKSIIKRLQKAFPEALTIDGSVSSKVIRKVGKDGKTIETSKRQQIVDKFQTEPKYRILIAQLQAAGIGLNLTAASCVLFLELGWTANGHKQAEDRALRIGQKNKVSVYYMVARRTIELKLLNIIHNKDTVDSAILDGKKKGTMQILNMFIRKAKSA
jgi:SWI/SNF-related matrix-associated actin-dependent regulator of chromatin subfamily A-like protein 1